MEKLILIISIIYLSVAVLIKLLPERFSNIEKILAGITPNYLPYGNLQEINCISVQDFKAMLSNVDGSTNHKYGVKDNLGNSMDTSKIIYSPEKNRYLAVYHSDDGNRFSVWLAESTDLLNWNQQVKLFDSSESISQPYIQKINDRYYVAAERDTGTYSYVQIKRYANADNLYTNNADRTLSITLTFSTSNDGTPSLIDLGNRILLGFHWNDVVAKADKQAIGYVDYELAGYSGMKKVSITHDGSIRGDIGDRDFIVINGVPLIILEGSQELRGSPNFWKSWRIYVGDVSENLNSISRYTLTQLSITNTGGGSSLANPSITILPSPNKNSILALVVSYFNFEADGPLIFYYDLPQCPTQTTTSSTSTTTTGTSIFPTTSTSTTIRPSTTIPSTTSTTTTFTSTSTTIGLTTTSSTTIRPTTTTIRPTTSIIHSAASTIQPTTILTTSTFPTTSTTITEYTTSTIQSTTLPTTTTARKEKCPFDCCEGKKLYYDKKCPEKYICTRNKCVPIVEEKELLEHRFYYIILAVLIIFISAFMMFFVYERKQAEWKKLYDKWSARSRNKKY